MGEFCPIHFIRFKHYFGYNYICCYGWGIRIGKYSRVTYFSKK